MKKSEIKGLSVTDLKAKLTLEKEVLAKLKFAHAISPIENPMKIRHSRKFIAQLSAELGGRK